MDDGLTITFINWPGYHLCATILFMASAICSFIIARKFHESIEVASQGQQSRKSYGYYASIICLILLTTIQITAQILFTLEVAGSSNWVSLSAGAFVFFRFILSGYLYGPRERL